MLEEATSWRGLPGARDAERSLQVMLQAHNTGRLQEHSLAAKGGCQLGGKSSKQMAASAVTRDNANLFC